MRAVARPTLSKSNNFAAQSSVFGGVHGRRQYSTEATALRYSKHGGFEGLKKETVTIPDPKGNEVLVKMLAAPINPADMNIVQGTYPVKQNLPAIAGSEGVGVVQAVGPQVKNLKKDARVIVAKPGQAGTWTTHNLFAEDTLDVVPDDIPIDYAAMLAINPSTAYRLLNDFVPLKEGDVVIQNCANSIVGQSVIQLAKAKKLVTINVIRPRYDEGEMVERLKHVGGSVVVDENYARSPNLKKILADLPPPKLALNGVGGASATNLAQLLGDGGVMVNYGAMSRQPVTIPSSSLMFKDITVKGFWLHKWLAQHSAEERRQMQDAIIPMIRNKDMVLFTEHLPLDNFERALAKAFQPHITRKVIFHMEN